MGFGGREAFGRGDCDDVKPGKEEVLGWDGVVLIRGWSFDLIVELAWGQTNFCSGFALEKCFGHFIFQLWSVLFLR